jgi:hypothetical protein
LKNKIKYLPAQSGECCTSYATLLAVEMMHEKPIYFSRLYLYYMTRKIRGDLRPTPARLKQTLEALKQYGVCLEEKYPSYLDPNFEPSSNLLVDSLQHRLLEYQEISNDKYKKYLTNGIPIIFGMSTGKLFWNLSGTLSKQKYKPINETDNRQHWGHAVTCVGYDDNLNGGSWIIANSLGPKWGDRGYAAIPYSCDSDIGESYVITNFTGITPVKNFSEFDK